MKFKITRKGNPNDKYKWPNVGTVDLTGEKPRISIKVDADFRALVDGTEDGKFLGVFLFADEKKSRPTAQELDDEINF